MTTIVIRKDSRQQYRGFLCMGHADYSRRKSQPDILCASISVLVINTINSLEELAHEKLTYTVNEETGFIRCDFEGQLQEKSVFLLDAMVFGLNTLSSTYGRKYLQVNFEEV